MPRPKHAGAPEPKKRSRTGCWPCKARKVKCGEEKPQCSNCTKQGEVCDYSIRLQWGGRSKKDQDAFAATGQISFTAGWSSSCPSSSSTPAATPAPQPTMSSYLPPGPPTPSEPSPPRHVARNAISKKPTSSDAMNMFMLDPQLMASMEQPRHGASHAVRPPQHASGSQIDFQRHFPIGASIGPDNTPSSNSPSQAAFDSPLNLPNYHQGQDQGTTRDLRRTASSSDFNWSDQHQAKRIRLSSPTSARNTLPPLFNRPDLPDGVASNPSQYDQPSPGSIMFTPFSANSNVGTPGTPGSSVISEETSARVASRSHFARLQHSPDLRRLSVNSLLSGPADDHESQGSRGARVLGYPKTDLEGSTIYGYDYGYPDLDVSKNNDATAIIPQSPATVRDGMSSAVESPMDAASSAPSPAPSKEAAFQPGGYYAQPVPIKISKEFEPLPPCLTDSPMNLLYFHHFLNHTARVLTPHDCPDNPLRTILPKMAIHNPDLMNLLFAYSASHRARLLSHPEPKDRIAYWVRDVFPNLRHALSSREPVSDATLATAIMLASREIITPNTFEVKIPWQNHLGIARQMIIQRGGLKDMGDNGNPIVNFLARWFAYLDVIGSLSGYKNDIPLSEAYWSSSLDDISLRSKSTEGDDHGFAIDCFFGFTNCCITLLAKVAKLAHECDKERIDADGNVDPSWLPADETREAAEKLVVELSENRGHVYAGCRHSMGSDKRDWDTMSENAKLDLQEIVSVNEAFHLAGLIHLYRRVLGRPSADDGVQDCVRQVLAVLSQIRKGGTADSCLLFPMFTAGCDAIEEDHRASILERLRLVEGLGMTHVQKARLLMQQSWDTGKPWETLVSGEFFG